MTTPLKPTLFDKDEVDNWKHYLDKNGFVVIKNVLTNDEKIHAFNLFKTDLTVVSPKLDFEDKNTLTIDNCPLMFGKGMAIFNGFGQSDAMWNLRLNSSIKTIFKKVYDCEDLVVSMDGFSMFVSSSQKSKSWLHIDQNPKTTLYSIQSSYNFLPVQSEKDAGFVVVPKSHKTYKPKVEHKKDWFVCPTDDPQLENVRKLIIPENCITLWNSKLIHANEGMSKDKKIEFNRLTAYISYQPKINRSTSIYQKRLDAYNHNDTTSHWATKCELKKYPWGFAPRYMSRGFNTLKSRMDIETIETPTRVFSVKKIPIDRLELI